MQHFKRHSDIEIHNLFRVETDDNVDIIDIPDISFQSGEQLEVLSGGQTPPNDGSETNKTIDPDDFLRIYYFLQTLELILQ